MKRTDAGRIGSVVAQMVATHPFERVAEGQAYSDPKRASDPHALPDVEVFYDDSDIPPHGSEPRNYDSNGEPVAPGWYWWACFPGCLPDSDPCGPFASEEDALADAQRGSE